MKLKRFFAFKFNISFKRFRSRLLFYIIGLLLLTLAGVFGVIEQVFRQNTEETIHHELLVAERIFLRLLQERSAPLTQQATALASDFAFRRVIATQDNATISSALMNLSRRVNADAAFLLAVDYRVMVDSLHLQNTEFATELIKQAEKQGKATRLILINQIPYQVIVVPVLAPEPIAWLCLGFAIDNTVLAQLKQLTQVEISLLSQQNAHLQLHASTLPAFATQTVLDYESNADGFFWRSGNELYLSRLLTLEQNNDTKIIALIERSWQKALENFYRLQWLLLIIALISIALVSLAALWLAKTVSKPVQLLARGVQAIEQGDYSYQVQHTGDDEIGKLGAAFNNMGVQLLEKELIRSTFNKYVDPAIVAELLSQPDKLKMGGERKKQTVLFSDIAGFTNFSEQIPAEALVSLLNRYLTAMTAEISREQGVLDKFIGDAIMAFWTEQLCGENYALHACRCALAMQETLKRLRPQWLANGEPEIQVRIGIATGEMIVGNIGSDQARSYTCIGDKVNYSSRLEGLNKYYGTQIIVDRQTVLDTCAVVRELDTVRVKGRQEGESIYELLALSHQAERSIFAKIEHYQSALVFYKQGDFFQAAQLFAQIDDDAPSYLMLERCQQLLKNPPENWDGVYSMLDK